MKNNRLLICLIAIWFACAPITFGITNASFRASSPYLEHDTHWTRQNCRFAAFYTILGPITLASSFFLSGFAEDGFSYSCKSVKGNIEEQ